MWTNFAANLGSAELSPGQGRAENDFRTGPFFIKKGRLLGAKTIPDSFVLHGVHCSSARLPPMPLPKCSVSGQELGSNGKPHVGPHKASRWRVNIGVMIETRNAVVGAERRRFGVFSRDQPEETFFAEARNLVRPPRPD